MKRAYSPSLSPDKLDILTRTSVKFNRECGKMCVYTPTHNRNQQKFNLWRRIMCAFSVQRLNSAEHINYGAICYYFS